MQRERPERASGACDDPLLEAQKVAPVEAAQVAHVVAVTARPHVRDRLHPARLLLALANLVPAPRGRRHKPCFHVAAHVADAASHVGPHRPLRRVLGEKSPQRSQHGLGILAGGPRRAHGAAWMRQVGREDSKGLAAIHADVQPVSAGLAITADYARALAVEMATARAGEMAEDELLPDEVRVKVLPDHPLLSRPERASLDDLDGLRDGNRLAARVLGLEDDALGDGAADGDARAPTSLW